MGEVSGARGRVYLPYESVETVCGRKAADMSEGDRKVEVRRVTNGLIVVCYEAEEIEEGWLWMERECLIYKDPLVAAEKVREWVSAGMGVGSD